MILVFRRQQTHVWEARSMEVVVGYETVQVSLHSESVVAPVAAQVRPPQLPLEA
jgi:hypothetical protein